MFSEGADTKASTGLLNSCGGFYILVFATFKQHEGQRQKAPNLKLPPPPELTHIFMEEQATQTHALFHFTLHLSLSSSLSIVKPLRRESHDRGTGQTEADCHPQC
jgi:hypothetical protein